MPNPYYTYENDLTPATRARSSELDEQFAAIEAAFDALSSVLVSGDSWGGEDIGLVNAMDVTTDAGSTAPYDQQMLIVRPAVTNTGPTTLALNSGDQYSVTRNDGTPVQANDLLAGLPVIVVFDDLNSRWVLIGATAEQTRIGTRPVIREIAETAYTLGPDDEQAVLVFTSDDPITVTVPANATVALDTGFLTHLYQDGAGAITVEAAPGVTMLKPDSLSVTTSAQYGSLTLLKRGADAWRLTKLTYEENFGTDLYRPSVLEVALTTHSITAEDENRVLIFTSSDPVTVTIQDQATEPVPDGFLVHLYQDGTGTVSVEADPGVTLTYSATLDPETSGQGTSVSLLKVADDDWRLIKLTFEEPGDFVFRPEVTTSALTAYTLSAADENRVVTFTSADAVAVTIPDNATVPLDVGFLVHVYQDGAGQITVSGDVGVTLTYSLSNKTRAQYSSLTLVKVDTDDWRLVGDAALSA